MSRSDEIFHAIGIGFKEVSDRKRADLLTEISLIDQELYERLIHSRFKASKGKSIFILSLFIG
jgi:hypothetical protein